MARMTPEQAEALAIRRKSDNAIVVFNTRMEFQNKNDHELRLVIKTLREMILHRQQVRATERLNRNGGR